MFMFSICCTIFKWSHVEEEHVKIVSVCIHFYLFIQNIAASISFYVKYEFYKFTSPVIQDAKLIEIVNAIRIYDREL